MAELRPNIVFYGCHFVRHHGICNPICVKLLPVMSGVIPSNVKEKRRLYLKPFSWGPQTRHTHTQTHRHTRAHTHDDSIRRNARRCISPKNVKEWQRMLEKRVFNSMTTESACLAGRNNIEVIVMRFIPKKLIKLSSLLTMTNELIWPTEYTL